MKTDPERPTEPTVSGGQRFCPPLSHTSALRRQETGDASKVPRQVPDHPHNVHPGNTFNRPTPRTRWVPGLIFSPYRTSENCRCAFATSPWV